MRGAVSSPRVALVALIVVAAWSLARCFVGAGVVFPAIVAGLIALASIQLASWAGARYRSLGVLAGLVGALIAFMSPVWITSASATTLGWPTFSTFHVIGTELSDAWTLFNQLRAPVPETAGFTIIGAWAVAVAALLAGWAAVDGDTSLWVVAPPAAIFLFTSALGTTDWRGEAIAAEVVALAWYTAAARSARLARTAPVAVPVQRGGATHAPPPRRRAWVRASVPAVLMIATAALLAAMIGPRLPGALSPALVSLRDHPIGGNALSGGIAGPPSYGQVAVSTLVQVAEEEIFQSPVPLFSVETTHPSYLVLTTLDTFDGDRWTQSPAPAPAPLPPTSYPAKPVGGPTGPDSVAVLSQISIENLGSNEVPASPTPIMGNGSGARESDLSYSALTDTIQSDVPLEPNALFFIVSSEPDEPPSQTAAATLTVPGPVLKDLQLPSGIPQQIITLAHQIVAGATTPYDKALALQDYFHTNGYMYNLPHAASAQNPVVTGGEGLNDLVNFLFTSKSGFCQQYSSAFAVLARIDGLPTRIAVGFQPGSAIAPGDYSVTGKQVHAWPQVYLGGTAGWTSFEPTPGSRLPAPITKPSRGGKRQTGGGSTQGGRAGGRGKGGPAHNFRPPPADGAGGKVQPLPNHKSSSAQGSSGLGDLGVFYVFLGLGVVIFGMAPLERTIRRRRARSPATRVLAAWRSAINTLSLVGLAHHKGESYNDLARRVSKGGALGEEVGKDLTLLANVSTVAAFSATPPSADSVRQAEAASRRVSREAHHRAGAWRTLWSIVTPAGLLDREVA